MAALIQPVVYETSRVVARVFGAAFFSIRVTGRDQIPAEGGALIVANHQSYLDPILVGLCSRRQIHYLARESLFRSGPFRWLIQMFNAIPIQRDGMGLGGLKATMRLLKANQMVLIFPEGTRTHDGSLGVVRPGFQTLLRRTRVSVVPIGISGAFEAWPRRRLWPRRHPIRIHIGPTLSAAAIMEMDDQQLHDDVTQRMQECLHRAQQAPLESNLLSMTCQGGSGVPGQRL